MEDKENTRRRGNPQNKGEEDLLVRAKEKHCLTLMVKANVIGIGVGQRIREGNAIDELVVKVYVSRKLPKDLLGKEDLIPPTLDFNNKKVPVDVEESRVPMASAFTLRSRPVMGGSSIGPSNRAGGSYWVGTLGTCVVLEDGQPYILSNNHVLAAVDQLTSQEWIVQPGVPDGGIPPTLDTSGLIPQIAKANDLVAFLSRTVPIRFGFYVAIINGVPVTLPLDNVVDCAVALVYNGFNLASREIHCIGYPYLGWHFGGAPPLGTKVSKMGRTTGLTFGIVRDVSWNGWVDYSAMFGNLAGTNRAWFVRQMMIEGSNGVFSNKGDSGSMIVTTESMLTVGLLFADNGKYTFANRITDVIDQLRIPWYTWATQKTT